MTHPFPGAPAPVKLTPAQTLLLGERIGCCDAKYRPLVKLKELGLVSTKSRLYGRVDWSLTKAGEKHLASLPSA